MAGTKEIKRRIKSVKNTKKITKAMELVAASKMRRAVAQALSSRLYAGYSWELLTSLTDRLDDVKHSFFKEKKDGKTLVVLITSNGSLCGGYNAQVTKKAILKLKELENAEVDLITVGKKGDNAMRRVGQNIIATFTEIPAVISLRDITPISSLLINEYKKGTYKDVYVAYTDFVSALTQKPNIKKLLPISKEEFKDTLSLPPQTGVGSGKYVIDGNANELVDTLAEKLVRMQIYQMMLESGASEQSARMVAMKNASEAAGEMIDDLTLVFNKARQAGITQEISEISAGMASVS